jgi:hypothetical protein
MLGAERGQHCKPKHTLLPFKQKAVARAFGGLVAVAAAL